ncbi:MAG TPA: hypothetical protein VHM88_07295 [Candidatus Acidoferrales bacterium]|nr:hypothetical protein [Candidatus Acidoferrales bacterium]
MRHGSGVPQEFAGGTRMLVRWITESLARPMARLLAVLLVILLGASIWDNTHAQMQQSGGAGSNASVGSTGATAPTSATLAGGAFNTTLPTLTNGQMGAVQLDSSGRLLVGSIAGALPTGSNTIGAISNAGFNVTGSLPAGTNAIGTVRVDPLTSCGTTVYDSGITTVPTTEAAATTSATCVQAIYVNNLTSSAQTLSIKDNQGTPVVYVNAFSLPANSNMLLTFGGIKFSGGVRWVATNASSVNAQILGYQ